MDPSLVIASLSLLFAAALIFRYGRAIARRGKTVRFIFPENKEVPVSWDLRDAFLIGVLFFFFPGFLWTTARLLPESIKSIAPTIQEEDLPADFSESEDLGQEHPLTILLLTAKESPHFAVIMALCFITGVITAPLTEEFVFRVLFQGALERFLPFSRLPIFLPALLFALIHFRTPSGIPSITQINAMIQGMIVTLFAHFIILTFGIIWLRTVRKAGWAEMGIVRKGLFKDFLRGVTAFIFFILVMILIQPPLQILFPKMVMDPIPIFLLAVGLGILFHRSHRFASIVGMHFSLNFVSFCGILLMMN